VSTERASLLAPAARNRHRCPHCHKSINLWEAVTVQGWRSIDEYLDAAPDPGRDDRDVDWSTAEQDGWASPEVGCGECVWDGQRDQLQAIGIDGEPLPTVHPQQMEIAS
jgi:hypothetical protein